MAEFEKNDEAILAKIGEAFGDVVGSLIARAVVKSVTVTDRDDDTGEALVTIYEGDEPLRVPYKLLNADGSVLRLVPTIGATAAIIGLDGNINTAVMLSCESYDAVEFIRSKTNIKITIDPNDDSKDQIDVVVGDSTIQLTEDKITFNGGDKDGLVIAADLTKRLNAIENDINSLKTAFSSWVVSPQDGGAALKGGTAGWAAQRLTLTKDKDYMNDKISQ